MKNLIIILYSLFLILFAIFSYAFVDPNLFYLKSIYSDFAFSNRFLTTSFYLVFIFIFFIFYGIFIWLGIKNKLKFKDTWILLGITIVVLFFSYPAILSYDIFNYIATSKVLFNYHENPYIVMPIEFLGDPLLSFTRAANKIALYAPSWIILTGIPYFLGSGNFIITLFSFKLFITIFYLATIFLIWKISKNIISMVLFAFNPLIVIETLVGGHNDIVMMFFALFAMHFAKTKKLFYMIIFFVLSFLIKYSTIVLLPIFIYIFIKTVKKEQLNWSKIYLASAAFLFLVFLLSPIREEIYPWYSIWFLSFIFLIPFHGLILYLSLVLSFSLLLRYTPYMYLGTYLQPTPIIKQVVTIVPVVLFTLFYVIKKKI